MMDANRKPRGWNVGSTLLHHRATKAFWIGASVFSPPPACAPRFLLFVVVVVAVGRSLTTMGGRFSEWKVDIRPGRTSANRLVAHHIINNRAAVNGLPSSAVAKPFSISIQITEAAAGVDRTGSSKRNLLASFSPAR